MIFQPESEFLGSASGRVNLIGEHTDYNHGFVLPMLLPQITKAHVSVRSDLEVRVSSRAHVEGQCRYVLGDEKRTGQWFDYIQGLTLLLRREGHAHRGFDAMIESDVPVGAGLSSSAALGIALLRGLVRAFDLKLTPIRMALLWQRVENEFVGARVGIMDPMACAIGEEGSAVFIDTESLQYRQIEVDPNLFRFVVIDSGVGHRHATGGYNQRRFECEAAAQTLGLRSLRELNRLDLETTRQRLRRLDETLRRRARHVVSENDRVLAAIGALETHDAHRLGQLLRASHASLRDDFEVSTPEIDTLIKIGDEEPDVLGGRITGGGFGGAVLFLTKPTPDPALEARILQRYYLATGLRAKILLPSLHG